jgi:hypothetical protein
VEAAPQCGREVIIVGRCAPITAHKRNIRNIRNSICFH